MIYSLAVLCFMFIFFFLMMSLGHLNVIKENPGESAGMVWLVFFMLMFFGALFFDLILFFR